MTGKCQMVPAEITGEIVNFITECLALCVLNIKRAAIREDANYIYT